MPCALASRWADSEPPKRFAQTALHLASSAGRFFTGSAVVIDGGLTAA